MSLTHRSGLQYVLDVFPSHLGLGICVARKPRSLLPPELDVYLTPYTMAYSLGDTMWASQAEAELGLRPADFL